MIVPTKTERISALPKLKLNSHPMTILSVLRHLRIHPVRPSRDPARQVVHLAESCLLQEGHRLGTASAHLAVHDYLAAGVQFIYALRQIIQGDQIATDVADLVLVRLAHIEHEQILFRVQTPLQIFHLYLGNSAAYGLLLSSNAAKLVVVYQLGNRGMRAADRAIWILTQFQFAELHSQSIHQQQAANEGLAHTKDQLDHFRSLHHSN